MLKQQKKLSDGIMRKARRGHPLTDEGKQRNRYLSNTRYAAEQGFGTLHRKFRCRRATYFGLRKANAQSHLKAVCLNLPQTANKFDLDAPAA
ncbi:transposase [Neisseria yangbaofengii]|uniref:transposase n=1 Tax=Neisseria yangbaofengii TaxID=2709396 RepID=UPI0013EA7BB5|nr:transposase [Neisseria yangbaofengii]